MGFVVIFTFILILFSAPNSAIVIKIIPEILNGFNHNFDGSCEIPCQFSGNPSSPDAEFFIVMNDDYVRDAIATPPSAPFRLIGGQEPPHYYHLMKPEFLKHHFHGTSFLYRHSDIPWLLRPGGDLNRLRLIEVSAQAQPKATFVARNCNAMNNRKDYVKAIDEVVGVVSPSSCLNNAEWPQCGTKPCTKTETIHDYKFHLAFENGDSPGFITDRIYHSFEAGVLPVWMGTREVAEVVPPGSYIDVAEFDGPYDVANYLKMLLDNETLYASYFEWKKKPLDPEFEEENRVLWTESFQCRSCYFVDALKRGLEWDHLRQRAKSDTETTHEVGSKSETQNTHKEAKLDSETTHGEPANLDSETTHGEPVSLGSETTHGEPASLGSETTHGEPASLDLETTHVEAPEPTNPTIVYITVRDYSYRSYLYLSMFLNLVLLALLTWKKCFKNFGRHF